MPSRVGPFAIYSRTFATTMTLTASLLLFSVLAFSQASPTGHKKPIKHKSPTQQLQWGPCGDILTEILPANTTAPPVFDCATLPVPLDYTDEHSPLLNLSLVRVKATQEPVLGSVLTNPGGPGGSGVENIVLGYPLYQEYCVLTALLLSVIG